MTQQFRTFTQKLTDKSNGTTRIFNVRAKTIVDRFGNDVIDGAGNRIWFPETFEPAAAVAFGRSLASKSTIDAAQALRRAVEQGGPWDLQRSYNGQSNGLFASLFTNAASYTYGLIGAAAGFSPTTLMAGGGAYNLLKNPKTAGRNFGNNPNNPPFISKGIQDFFASSYGEPATIPTEKSSSSAEPTDRFQASFGRPLQGVLDEVRAAAVTGLKAPSRGFAHSTNDGSHSSFPEPLERITSFDRDGWWSSMHRNGEVERVIRSKAGSPHSSLEPPPPVFVDRFATWGTSPSGDAVGPTTADPASFGRRYQTWGTRPAGELGDTGSPVLRELKRYRALAVPNDLASTAAHGIPTPPVQPDAVSSPAGVIPTSSIVTSPKPEQLTSPTEPVALAGIFSDEPALHPLHAVWNSRSLAQTSRNRALFDFLAGISR